MTMEPHKVNPITTGVRYITPAEAAMLLRNMYHRQRPVVIGHVARIANDMTHGRFVLSPDPIVITGTGAVLNGQHRLRAIVDSATTQAVIVSHGWPESTYDVMDAGLRRTLSHRVNVEWMRHHRGPAIVRGAIAGTQDSLRLKVSEQGVVAVALEFSDHFESVLAYPSGLKIGAIVLAAVVRARMCGHDEERLRSFVYIVGTGLADSIEDRAAVALFSYLMQAGYQRRVGQYGKAQAALSAFISHRPLTKIYASVEDLFPRPETMLSTAGFDATQQEAA